MEKILVEAYTPATNYAIIRLPHRNFPGVVFQGDSLKILATRIGEISKLARQYPSEELHETIQEVQSLLSDLLKEYESVLAENNIPLPYVK